MNSYCNETAKILNAESREQLLKTRDAELAKIMKLRLILKELRRLRLEDQLQIKRALKVITIEDYGHLGDKSDDFLLNLQGTRSNVHLNYTERKVVREELVSNLRISLRNIMDFGVKLFNEFPEICNTQDSLPSATKKIGVKQQKLTALQVERREKLMKQSELLNQKCTYLKEAAELKMGPYVANELELLHAQALMTQIKANLLRDFFINELVSRSEHSLKAYKETFAYINEEVAKVNGDVEIL